MSVKYNYIPFHKSHWKGWDGRQTDEIVALLNDYAEHFNCGEVIYQDDEAQEKAIEVMSEIAEIIKPEPI